MYVRRFVAATALFSAMLPVAALAQLKPPAAVKTLNPDYLWDTVLCGAVYWIYTFAIVFSIISALFTAYKYMFANGDSKAVSDAHRQLLYTAIGVAVAIVAVSLPSLVATVVSRNPLAPVC